MGNGLICQVCGVEAPTRYVEFYQNIGALFMRFRRSIRGNLCKSCIHSKFWTMTSITLAVGWLGLISLIIAPIFIINNLSRYLTVLAMPRVPRGATRPQVNGQVAAQIQPLMPQIALRLQRHENAADIARELAPPGVTPGQVLVYLSMWQRQHAARAGAPAANVSRPDAATLPQPQTILLDSLMTPAKNPQSVFSSNTIGENQR